MTEIYHCNDYRDALKMAINRLSLRGEKVSSQSLAETAGIQAPYLSKVFNGHAELSSDQLFLICDRLGLSTDEEDFVKLLLDFSRCSIKRRKDLLKTQIKSLQNEKLSPSHQREKMAIKNYSEQLAQYYLDPVAQQVHMLMTIPKWRQNTTLIATKLDIDTDRLAKILKNLEDLQIIEVKNKTYAVIKEQMHLPKNHPLCGPQQNLQRFAAANRLLKKQKDGFSFIATISADEKTKNQIQHNFMLFLKSVESLVEKAPNEEIYHLQFDIFNW
jgi:transcriptional regulator with XRE-family HTH domain